MRTSRNNTTSSVKATEIHNPQRTHNHLVCKRTLNYLAKLNC